MPAVLANEVVRSPYGRSIPFFQSEVYSVEATVTLAQINAGYTFLAATPDVTYKVVKFIAIVSGNFATATDIRISDTAGTPVDVATFAILDVTNGAVLNETATGVTLGSNFAAALTANQGLQLRKTGSAATGGTSIKICVQYKVNN